MSETLQWHQGAVSPKSYKSQRVAWALNHVPFTVSGLNKACVNMKVGLIGIPVITETWHGLSTGINGLWSFLV